MFADSPPAPASEAPALHAPKPVSAEDSPSLDSDALFGDNTETRARSGATSNASNNPERVVDDADIDTEAESEKPNIDPLFGTPSPSPPLEAAAEDSPENKSSEERENLDALFGTPSPSPPLEADDSAETEPVESAVAAEVAKPDDVDPLFSEETSNSLFGDDPLPVGEVTKAAESVPEKVSDDGLFAEVPDEEASGSALFSGDPKPSENTTADSSASTIEPSLADSADTASPPPPTEPAAADSLFGDDPLGGDDNPLFGGAPSSSPSPHAKTPKKKKTTKGKSSSKKESAKEISSSSLFGDDLGDDDPLFGGGSGAADNVLFAPPKERSDSSSSSSKKASKKSKKKSKKSTVDLDDSLFPESVAEDSPAKGASR